MNRYFIELAYCGKAYCGWQIQENEPSVQETLEEAFSRILREEISIVGAGRTDTGVHAKRYFAHFESKRELSEKELSDYTHKLNSYLKSDIVIYKIFPVAADMHARFSAISRAYEYHIHLGKNPFLTDLSYEIHAPLDVNLMNEACRILYDYTDFSCFSKSNTQTKTNLCTIQKAIWKREGHKYIFTIQANRFLRNMVRAIVGTMIEIGQKKMDLDAFRKVIESKNRSEAGLSVPAKGLFLVDVVY